LLNSFEQWHRLLPPISLLSPKASAIPLMDNFKYVPVSFLLDSANHHHQQLVTLELISEQGGP
jgi:hypothetical protein